MVEFGNDNLLVLLGQEPDAHLIFMDQNQLSAYVHQDPFPLFTNDLRSTSSEFGDLVQKILGRQIKLDASFLNAVFNETSGHPFLTVNLLREFVDWLIEQRRPVSQLDLSDTDFADFAAAKLKAAQLMLSPEYQFFRGVISEALGSDGRDISPWLHLVYSALRDVTRAADSDYRCLRSDYEVLVEMNRASELGFTPEGLLGAASRANFLAFDETHVWPRIRMLGRLSTVVQPRV